MVPLGTEDKYIEEFKDFCDCYCKLGDSCFLKESEPVLFEGNLPLKREEPLQVEIKIKKY